MNEALQTQLAKILGEGFDLAKSGVLAAVQVMQETAPQLVEEIYRWESILSITHFILGLGFVVAGFIGWVYLMKYMIKEAKAAKAETEWLFPASIISFLVIQVLPICVTFTHLNWLKILIAPKLFLVNYITTMF